MIKGSEIILRHVQQSELETLIGLLNDPEIKGEYARTLLNSPVSLKKQFELNGFSSEASEMFVISDELNQLIGVMGHFTTVHYSSARELGFSVFTKENYNKGIATAAVNLLTNYIFENLPVNRVQICMPVEHKACERIAIKCGYTKEGIVRGSIFVRGRYLDTFMYSKIRSEFSVN
ncbi:MAG: GNAT family protein [Pseudomonadota bacterium]